MELKGRVAVVTGANQGIGFETAKGLAARGATLHIVCRNRERGEAARAAIVAATSNEAVQLHVADLSSLAQTKALAETLLAQGPLHFLVNNAGCLVNPRTETSEGLEANFATNTLAPFVLTELLLPALAQAQPAARVVAVSSGGQYTEELVVGDLQWATEGGFDGARQYARDKSRQTALTERWAQDHPNLLFFTMHPGWAGACALPRATLVLPR